MLFKKYAARIQTICAWAEKVNDLLELIELLQKMYEFLMPLARAHPFITILLAILTVLSVYALIRRSQA